MTAKQWYITVGVPGGQYACLATSVRDAHARIDAYFWKPESEVEWCLDEWPDLSEKRPYTCVRLAPQELVRWLDNQPPEPATNYIRVVGGWVWCNGDCAVFTPVALAGGITVLHEEESDD